MMYTLPDNSPIRDSVLPAIWAGYKSPSVCPPLEIIDSIGLFLQQNSLLSQEEASNISSCFWRNSVHDFCIQYLGKDLTDEDHAKILKMANEFVKNGTAIKIDEKETDLIKLLASKVVLNAHQRANHAMSHACFLNKQGILPKENVFMLQKGISPVFYEQKEFDLSESLKKDVQGVPKDRLLGSFTDWINHAGMRYIPAFNQMGGLLRDMKYMNALILTKSVELYTRTKRIEHHRHRSFPRRRSLRTYGE